MILSPEDLIKKLLLPRSSCIADFGAGSGAFTLAAAEFFREGKVYSIDIQRLLLPMILKKVSEKQFTNVSILSGDIETLNGTPLKDASVDAVIIANTLFQIENKAGAAEESKRILRLGGKILLVDWMANDAGLGPRKDALVLPEAALAVFQNSGFVFQEELPVGEYHYGMILDLPSISKK